MNKIFNKCTSRFSLSDMCWPMVLSSSNKKDNLKKIKGIDEDIEKVI